MKFPRRAKRILSGAASAALLVEATGCLCLDRFMFHPPAPYGEDVSPHLVRIGDPGGDIAALWLPCPGAEHAILYSHGNGEDLSGVRWLAEFYRSLGFSVLVYDYPGYGLSDGRPTEQGVYRSAEAAFRHLVDGLGYSEDRVLVVGYSIGTGPSCYLAEKHPGVHGLVLLAPFLSAPRAITRIRVLPVDPFPNLARIRNVGAPVLVVHGTRDGLIPFRQGARLAKEAGGTLLPVEGANHHNIVQTLGTDRFGEILKAFDRGEDVR